MNGKQWYYAQIRWAVMVEGKEGLRHWEEAVNQARMELSRRKLIRIGDRAPDCTEQEDILRRALRNLDEAEDKLARARRWQPRRLPRRAARPSPRSERSAPCPPRPGSPVRSWKSRCCWC